MIYVVKCYSCEHEFKVKRGENGADMMCPHCGTANNIRDVIERIEDALLGEIISRFITIVLILGEL